MIRGILREQHANYKGLYHHIDTYHYDNKKRITINNRRKKFLLDNLIFHLDKIKGLGNFIEIIFIDSNGQSKEEREKILKQRRYYMHLFEIKKEDLITDSYCNLFKKFVDKN